MSSERFSIIFLLLNFKTGEIDEEGYPDEARLDDVEFMLSSYIRKINLSNFAGAWDSNEYECKSTTTFKKPGLSNLQRMLLCLRIKKNQKVMNRREERER